MDTFPDSAFSLEVAKQLSFPRLSTSKAAAQAREMIADLFRQIGYKNIQRDPFMTTTVGWLIGQFLFTFLAILLLSALVLSPILPWLSLIISGLIIFLLIFAISLILRIEGWCIRRQHLVHESENLFVRLTPEKPAATIVFSAHWDSKSQWFPFYVRSFLFISVLSGLCLLWFGSVVLSGMGIAGFEEPKIIYNLFLVACGCLLCLTVLFCFNRTTNKSAGSVDNAASVGLLLGLAKYFRSQPPQEVELIFLATGAEEVNLGGAKDFLERYQDQLDPESTYFINLDGVGAEGEMLMVDRYGIPAKQGSNLLCTAFQEVAEGMSYQLVRKYLPVGAWSDFLVFATQGYESTWIGNKGATRYIHTKHDVPARIVPLALDSGLQLCHGVVQWLVQRPEFIQYRKSMDSSDHRPK